jgi:hypothetical protein
MDQNPLADIAGLPISQQRNSRIPFEELCGLYAALQWDVPLGVIIRASELDKSSVYHLRGAGTFRSGQLRYPRVAQEFAKLGKADFSTKYLTAPLKDRLRVAHDEYRRNATMPRLQRISPNASAFAGVHTLKDPLGGPDQTFEIVFDRGERPGWTWRDRNPGAETDELRGDPRDQENRFTKSKYALDFCRLRFVPTEKQVLDGSNEAASDDSWFWAQKKLQK